MSSAALAQIQKQDLARRADLLRNLTGPTEAEKVVAMTALSQPEVGGILVK